VSEDGKGSDGFIFIAIILFIVVVGSLGFIQLSSIIQTIVFWFIIIFIILIVGVVTAWFLYKIKKTRHYTTNAKLPLREDQPNESLLLGVVEIISLPQWADVSEITSQGEIDDLNVKQFRATEDLLRNCMSSHLPFGLLITWSDNRIKIQFWTSALEGEETNSELIQERLAQLDDYLKTNFQEIQTKCYFTTTNLLIHSLPQQMAESAFRGAGIAISGKQFLSSNDLSPHLNNLHLFFKRISNSQRNAQGFICFTCLPEEKNWFEKRIDKWLANRKYRQISQKSQKNITENQLFSSKKLSTNQLSIQHQDQLSRLLLDYEKTKANTINHLGIILGIVTSSSENDHSFVQNLLQRAKGTLGQIVNPNDENSYQFTDLSQEELEEQLSKMFFVDKYLLPNTSECLSQEQALLMRMPNMKTGVQITRDERSFLPRKRTQQLTTGSFLIGYTRSQNDLELFCEEIYWNYKNLLKHTFISGATGGGKTYTISNFVLNAVKDDIPVIILDFGKGELYSFLQSIVPELKVFTIGDDSTCPIRINPLECPEWNTPQEHFDNLKTILDASLPQFEPLPIVTYRTLSRLFNTDGWTIGEGEKGKTRTIEDLLETGLAVIDDVGYAEEVYSNMKGAWQMRIGSLMEGSLGRQLYTQKSIPIEEFLSGVTIIEIRSIESSAQKMVTLTLLTLIFDYFKSLGPTKEGKPRCLLVLDEAESIFASAESFGNDIEMVTTAYKAVQKLNQILRQGRGYRLATILATQSPTNISHEIIANTENKIVHRLHHGKDKQVIQEALELTNTQTAKLSSLKPGESYAIDGDNEFPYFMKVNLPKINDELCSEREKKQQMKQHMQPFYQKYPWMKEVYSGSPEKEFDRLFDNAVISIEERMSLSERTRNRIELLLKREEFIGEFRELVRKFSEAQIDERVFYEELLDLLHDTSSRIIGENKKELHYTAMELIRAGLAECSFLEKYLRDDILKTIRELVFIDGGS